jgi:hypothetical protein
MRTGLIALVVAAAAGTANAAVTYGFEAGLAADGWTAQAATNGFTWEDMPGIGGNSNYVNNSVNAPIADHDAFGSGFGAYDTSLISPAQNDVGPGTLSYELNYINLATDRLEVYYGATLLFTHNTDTGGFFSAASGVAFSHAIVGAAGDQVRFRFVNEDPDAWDWYAQVDNVTIDIIPAPASLALVGLGGLVAGRRRR